VLLDYLTSPAVAPPIDIMVSHHETLAQGHANVGCRNKSAPLSKWSVSASNPDTAMDGSNSDPARTPPPSHHPGLQVVAVLWLSISPQIERKERCCPSPQTERKEGWPVAALSAIVFLLTTHLSSSHQ